MTQTNEEEAIEKFTEAILTEVRSKNGWVFSRLEGKIREMFTTLLTSRDTYWKERVRKEVEKMKVGEVLMDMPGTTNRAFDEGHNQALDQAMDIVKDNK